MLLNNVIFNFCPTVMWKYFLDEYYVNQYICLLYNIYIWHIIILGFNTHEMYNKHYQIIYIYKHCQVISNVLIYGSILKGR
jgi:hypothetical protein